MGLPWVRLDGTIPSHDKTLAALTMPGGKAAMAVYMFALAWSGAHGTDGHIPTAALPMIHCTPRDARTLAAVGLWDHHPDGGWQIHNWNTRQQLAVVTDLKRHSQRVSAARTNCQRWHGPNCGCWQETEANPPL
jgi:hypothetical protein